MYDGEGKVAWPEHLDDFHVLMEGMEDFNETKVCSLLAHTLRDHPLQWCGTLPHNSVHSFKQFSNLIEYVFHHFDSKVLDKKLFKQQKALHKSPVEFSKHFHLFMFEAPKC